MQRLIISFDKLETIVMQSWFIAGSFRISLVIEWSFGNVLAVLVVVNQLIILSVTSFYDVTRQHVDYVHNVIFLFLKSLISIWYSLMDSSTCNDYLAATAEL